MRSEEEDGRKRVLPDISETAASLTSGADLIESTI
jgi:hypothetical protein